MPVQENEAKQQNKKFNIYRSSAGSGKTFTLTKEYLKLVLATPAEDSFSRFYFRNILAVTFTNDAANEMKERILHNLKEIAQLAEDEKHPMLELILKELSVEYPQNTWSEEGLKAAASEVHETILHNYADFAVSTIDAFSSRVVKSFKKDLNLPYSFDIELDTDELVEEAVDLLQAEIGREHAKELTYFLVDFAKKKADSESSWYVDDTLKQFAGQLFKEENSQHIEALAEIAPLDFKKIISDLYKYINGVEKAVQQIGENALNLLYAYDIDYTDLYRGKSGIGALFNKAKGGAKLHELNVQGAFTLQFVQDDKLCVGKVSKAKIAAVENIKPNLIDLYHQLEGVYSKELSNYILATNLARNIYLLATINELKKMIDGIKAEKHIVHISDFNKKINEIVEEEPVPYIYERLGERYKHILIDEFQDTSKMQWHNLIPLLLNALAQNMTNLVVGDAKQAIYRWRGGKASMLVDLPNVPTLNQESLLVTDINLFEQNENPLQLTVNRRSHDNVVDFNNGIFNWTRDSFSSVHTALANFYKDVSQETNNKEGGRVLLEFFETKLKKEAYEPAVFERTFYHIKELTEQRGYQLSDIAILVRSNGKGAFIAEKLMEKGVNVVSNDSLLLANAAIINFIIDFIRVIAFPVNPLIKINLVQFLEIHFKGLSYPHKPLQGQDYEGLKEIISNNDLATFFNWLNTQYSTSLEPRGIQFRTIYEIAEELIRQFHLDAEVEQQIYLQKLLDVVLSFSTKKGNSLLEFLDYWELKKKNLSVTSPAKSNAVRVMTIHKSKGLQFPVVIMPFADWEFKGKRSEKWFSMPESSFSGQLQQIILSLNEQLEKTVLADQYREEIEQQFIENVNLLYVGFTRAEQCLIALSKEKNLSKDQVLPKSISELLYVYAGTLEVDEEEITLSIDQESDEVIALKTFDVFGASTSDEQKNETSTKENVEHTNDYQLQQFIHTSSLNKIRLRKNTLRYDDSDISLNEIFSARKEGILMHYAFEKVTYKDDIERAVETLHKEGLIQADDMPMFIEKMEKVVSLPLIAKYFDKSAGIKVKNEKEIILGGQRTSIGKSLRPDRIVRLKDELAIIDYKTGQENEKKYAQQIKSYASAFRKMGYEQIKLFIVYTEKCLVKQVE